MRGSNIVSVFELQAPDRLMAQCCQVSGLYEGFVLLILAHSILICGCASPYFFFALSFIARSAVDRRSFWCLIAVVLVKPFVCGSKLPRPSNMGGRRPSETTNMERPSETVLSHRKQLGPSFPATQNYWERLSRHPDLPVGRPRRPSQRPGTALPLGSAPLSLY